MELHILNFAHLSSHLHGGTEIGVLSVAVILLSSHLHGGTDVDLSGNLLVNLSSHLHGGTETAKNIQSQK